MSQQPQPQPIGNLSSPTTAPTGAPGNAPPKSNRRFYIVLACGIASTILALLLVYLLQNNADTNPMGWYADYVFPAGAIFVGLLASSGYGAAAWKTGLAAPAQ